MRGRCDIGNPRNIAKPRWTHQRLADASATLGAVAILPFVPWFVSWSFRLLPDRLKDQLDWIASLALIEIFLGAAAIALFLPVVSGGFGLFLAGLSWRRRQEGADASAASAKATTLILGSVLSAVGLSLGLWVSLWFWFVRG